jgi:peptide chain release factor subunit 1
MATLTLTRDRLRRLAEVRPEQARVLSVFIDLDPTRFATPPARATQITSLLSEGRRRIDEETDLSGPELQALREDLDRAEERLRDNDLAANGTRGVAIFACGPEQLLEVVRVPQAIESAVYVDTTAHIEPLASLGISERWGVLLCNRRSARIFAGTGAEGLEETDRIENEVHSRHDQGGWSQMRYQRSVEQDVYDHLQHTTEVLFEAHKRRPFDRLLVGAPSETVDEVEGHLHPYLRERLSGRVSLDVEHVGVDELRRAAGEIAEQVRAEREDRALDRLKEGLARGSRAAAGLDDVLSALNEARVELLLMDEGLSIPGTRDPETGMLAADASQAPNDTGVEPVEDVVDEAIQKALEQSADVLALRDRPDLATHGGIAAVLRF